MISQLLPRLLTMALLAITLTALAPRPTLASDALATDFTRVNTTFDAAAARLARDPSGAKTELTRVAADYARIASDPHLSDRSRAQAWFNTGVAHHLLGNLGDAVLAYRRAVMLDSSLPGLAENLARARTTVTGTSVTSKEPDPTRSLLQTATTLFTQWRAQIFTACLAIFVLTWGLLGLRLFFTGPRLIWPTVTGILTLALAATVGYPAWLAWDSARHAAVVRLETTPRLGPDTLTFGPAPTGPLRAGTEVTIAERRTGGDGGMWVKVRTTQTGQVEAPGVWLPWNAVEPVVPGSQS